VPTTSHLVKKKEKEGYKKKYTEVCAKYCLFMSRAEALIIKYHIVYGRSGEEFSERPVLQMNLVTRRPSPVRGISKGIPGSENGFGKP
jgi:hypothetical protein